jgi:hypothetical protein
MSDRSTPVSRLGRQPARAIDAELVRLGYRRLHANRGALDLDEVRSYFRLFDKESLLDAVLSELG